MIANCGLVNKFAYNPEGLVELCREAIGLQARRDEMKALGKKCFAAAKMAHLRKAE